MLGIVDMLKQALTIVANLTDEQRQYLQWRLSEEGHRYYSQEAENRFYDALAKGDTAVVDSGIAEKQERIRQLKQEVGLSLMLAAALFCFGCTPLSIPNAIPDKTPNALKTTERTYPIDNPEVSLPGQPKQQLMGTWYIVSKDFMIDHTRNQDDLLAALEQVKKSKHQYWEPVATAVGIALGMLLMSIIHGFAAYMRK